MRRILPYAKPYRWRLVLLLAAGSLEAASIAANPLLLKFLIDDGILKENTRLVVVVASVVAALALLDAFLGIAQRMLSARFGEQIIYDLRTRVFAHVQRQPIAFFTRAQTGSLVSRLNTDVIEAQQAMSQLLTVLVSSA
ncbi:ABC transporter transmembrane domain-containing protein, partial [Frankia casuarinae]